MFIIYLLRFHFILCSEIGRDKQLWRRQTRAVETCQLIIHMRYEDVASSKVSLSLPESALSTPKLLRDYGNENGE
jgi:hypothetical protein